jgi:hypothetical protein
MENLPPIELNDLKLKIINDDVKVYNNDNAIILQISNILENSNSAINEVKDIIIPLVDELVKLSGDHMLINHRTDIINFINTNPKYIVDTLISKCYEEKNGLLRYEIVKGDEEFFLKNNFDDMTDGDDKLISIIFKFKNFWHKLNTENKNMLKCYLLTIISYCDIRYINFKRYYCLKQLNPSFTSIYNQYDTIF